MAVFPKKLDMERLFRPPPTRRAVPAPPARPASTKPTSGKPGSWRVVTADGSTTVSSLERHAAALRDALVGGDHAEVLLRYDRNGRPTTIKLVSPQGHPVSLAELELVDTEATNETAARPSRPENGRTTKPKPRPQKPASNQPEPSPADSDSRLQTSNVDMPRANATLGEILRDKAFRMPPQARRGGWFARFTSRKKKADLFEIRPSTHPVDSKSAADPNGIDLDLVRVIELWPTLQPRIRDAILALVHAAG